MPEAKNRLHATRVDRIAIVDKGAVPDAEIVVFKRFKNTVTEKTLEMFKGSKVGESITEKYLQEEISFNDRFIRLAAMAAVDSLAGEVRESIYDENKAEAKLKIQAAFADFKYVIVNVVGKIALSEKAEDEKISQADAVKGFSRTLASVAINETLEFFKYAISYFMSGYDRLENPEGTLNAISDKYMGFVIENVTEIIKNKVFKETEEVVTDKVGRKISAARLNRLKKALEVLSEIIKEAEAINPKTQRGEGENMEDKQILEAIDQRVGPLTEKVDKMISVMEEKELILTDEKKAEIEKAEKEALEKRAVAVGLEKEASLEDIEKAEKKVADEKIEAEEKEKKEAKEKTEKAEKEAKETLDGRFDKISEKMEKMDGFVKAVSEKFGIKTSIDSEEDTENKKEKKEADPFGTVLRKKKKKDKE